MTIVMRRSLLAAAVALAVGTVAPRAGLSAAAAQDDAQIKRGQEVYTAQKCQVCHSIAGKGGKQSPLDGVGKKLSADDIRKWITHPNEMAKEAKSTKKPPMPNKYANLPKDDLDALVAYMVSLK